MKKCIFLFVLIFQAGVHLVSAQDPEPPQEDKEYFSLETPLTVDLETDEEKEKEDVKPKKKKRKKKVFYGLKTKKRFTRDGDTYEIFYVLKNFEMPDPYVRDVYWFDGQKIRVGGTIDPKNAQILHGPYKKEKEGQVLEEGIFYKGTKNGRWIRKNKENILVDKEKYYKGWPRDSRVSYYDQQHTRIKEIIPIEYGDREGNYYYFYPDGQIAVKGEYHWDQPVGEWTEYYQKGFRKKIIRYDKEAYEEVFRPFILREWDRRGKVVYEAKNQ